MDLWKRKFFAERYDGDGSDAGLVMMNRFYYHRRTARIGNGAAAAIAAAAAVAADSDSFGRRRAYRFARREASIWAASARAATGARSDACHC